MKQVVAVHDAMSQYIFYSYNTLTRDMTNIYAQALQVRVLIFLSYPE